MGADPRTHGEENEDVALPVRQRVLHRAPDLRLSATDKAKQE